MACPSFKEKISSYIDGMLGPVEKAGLEEHLKSCSRCREYYDELSRSVSRLHNLEEIEPPPWLRQNVMARIREKAASKKGFFNRLFLPPGIRLPAGALATIAVAVVTIYIFRSIEPDVRLAKAPYDEAARSGVPETVTPKAPDTSDVLREKAVAVPQKSSREEETAHPVPEKPLSPLMKKAEPQVASPGVGESRTEYSEEDKRAVFPEGRARTAMPAEQEKGEMFGYQARTPLPGKEKVREEAKKPVSPAPAAMPAMKDATAGGIAENALKSRQVSAVPKVKASAEMKKEVVSLTVLVTDVELGREEIRKAVRHLGGEILREEVIEKKKMLFVSIASQGYQSLLEKLRGIGEVSQGIPERLDASGLVEVRIELAGQTR